MAMRSAAVTSPSNDPVPCVVPRPVVLRSSLSSLQAASNDILRLSPLRGYYNQQAKPSPTLLHSSNEGWRGPPSSNGTARKTAPSAFLAPNKQDLFHHPFSPIAPSSFRPTIQDTFIAVASPETHPPVRAVRTSFSVCIPDTTQKDSIQEKNGKEDQEDGVEDEDHHGWNPPVREVVSQSQEQVYSPLTLPASICHRTTPPGFSQLPPPRPYGTLSHHVRPYDFVPIRERSHIERESLGRDKHWSQEYNGNRRHHPEEEEDLEAPFHSPTYERYGNRYFASSPSPIASAHKYGYHKPSPYSTESAKYGYRKPSPMAPSPSFTVETAEMTLDSMICDGESLVVPRERLLMAIASPPLYQLPTGPSSLALAASRSSYEGREARPRPHSAPTLGGRGTPTAAKNLNEDAQLRKCRLKTELCMHYENGRPCPFGANCTYAHGEEELQMTKLLDLHNAGLVDVTTHRTKPCLTWIATGSCPFGKRCTGIHDYRVGSSASHSWLPHTETQGNTIATDINVDALHQKRWHTILYDNPFGDQFLLTPSPGGIATAASTSSSWEDLYQLVCGGEMESRTAGGIKSARQGWIVGGNKRDVRRQVHPIYKLQIALKLRGTDGDWQYKYRPQHVVHEELCMVLQKRAFRVISNEPGDSGRYEGLQNKPPLVMNTATAISSVVEIPLTVYNPRLTSHILVHELAFGPDSDPSIRGVALWFNIVENDVTVCTPQQAKRFRWKKNGINPVTPMDGPNPASSAPVKPSIFDSGIIDSFPMIRPHDDSAFRMVTDMMKHRLAVLKRERLSNMKERFDALQKLQRQEDWLKERFVNHRRSWLHWAWPVNRGREQVDETTPVPPVEGPYLISNQNTDTEKNTEASSNDENTNPTTGSDTAELGKHVGRIWESFVTCLGNSKATMIPNNLENHSKQLPVFELLSQGIGLNENRNLPHILRSRFHDSDNTGGIDLDSNVDSQSERCWKALLLQDASSEIPNEWEIVREHFENSRSKKVLSIIQQ